MRLRDFYVTGNRNLPAILLDIRLMSFLQFMTVNILRTSLALTRSEQMLDRLSRAIRGQHMGGRLVVAIMLLSATTALSAAERYYIAHRGEYRALKDGEAVVDAPEGTRPTFERVRDKKINAVKLDLHCTADNVIVVSHDPNLKRTTGKDLPIIETKYEDLKDVLFLKKGEFEDERILTLDEALRIVKDCPLFLVDFKYHTPEMMTNAFKTFDANGIPRDHIMLATFTHWALEDAQKRYPEVRRVSHIPL